MPNRFALGDGMDGGGDWWSQNDPGQLHPYEQGGITGNATPGPLQAAPAGLPPLTGTPPYGNLRPDLPSRNGSPATAVGGPEQFGGNYEQWFRAAVGDRPWNQATLNNLMPVLSQYGIKLTPPNASGDQTKIQLPNGQWVRVGFGEGHPVWIPQGAGGGSAGVGGYAGPGAIPPPFQAPSFSDLQQEPGFQARIAMGQQGLERSAAAQGSLLSGGTQKALARYNQDFASNEYGQAYNRAFNTYMGNYQTQSADPWARFRDLYQGGLSAIGTSKTPTNPFAP